MHGDRAALGLHNMAGEGETQPGPLSRLTAVGELGKLLEQTGHLVGADADSDVFGSIDTISRLSIRLSRIPLVQLLVATLLEIRNRPIA